MIMIFKTAEADEEPNLSVNEDGSLTDENAASSTNNEEETTS